MKKQATTKQRLVEGCERLIEAISGGKKISFKELAEIKQLCDDNKEDFEDWALRKHKKEQGGAK